MTDLRQRHYRYRTDALAVDGTPTWGANEDTTYNPGAENFRLRVGLSNAAGTATGAVPWELYVSKNGGAYGAIGGTSGVLSADAGSSADDTSILVPRLTGLLDHAWVLEGGAGGIASVDMDFVNSRYYGGTIASLLSCSRASVGYAKNADGTLTQFGNDTLRITDSGLLVEDTRTNVVLWNRDLTNILWVAINITPAKDQTGPDGVGNSASSITATAGNGTILQTIVEGSSARYQSAYVKRITGTGTINMTMDNGSTWTAITVTSSWTLAEIPTQALANPIVGFQIVTSGDAIAVDLVQNENGVFASSPIPTTTTNATRAADVVSFTGNLDTVIKGAAWSAVCDAIITQQVSVGITPGLLGCTSGQNYIFFTVAGYNIIRTVSATSEIGATLGSSLTFFAGAKAGLAVDGSGRSIVGAGGTVTNDPGSAAPVVTGTVSFLRLPQSADYWYGYCRRFTIWNTRLVDATLQALTAP